jgi:phosphate transport system permease protein
MSAVMNAGGWRCTAPQARERLALTLSLAAMAFGLFWLIWILVETIRLGSEGWRWRSSPR